jgi:hypothetical protein
MRNNNKPNSQKNSKKKIKKRPTHTHTHGQLLKGIHAELQVKIIKRRNMFQSNQNKKKREKKDVERQQAF